MIDGTDQFGRLPAAWVKAGFQVDEMSLDRRVEVCARLAERLRFVDLHDQVDGTWGHWFDGDVSFVLARIASVDRYGLQLAFLKEVGSAPLPRLARRVMQLARLLDHWWWALGRSAEARPPPATIGRSSPRASMSGRDGGGEPPARPRPDPAAVLHEAIEQLIRSQLSAKLAWMQRQLDRSGTPAADFDPEASIWLPAAARPPATPPAPSGSGAQLALGGLRGPWKFDGPGDLSLDVQPELRVAIRSIYFAFLTAIAQVRDLARQHLPGTLLTGHHEPAAGLLLAFLNLYGTVQREINRFSERHIDFYYRDVLGLRPRASMPDRAHVACVPEAKAALGAGASTGAASGGAAIGPAGAATAASVVTERVEWPAGTAFVAGKDAAGQPLHFVLDQAFMPGAARVAELCTLRLERDQRISPECDLDFVTGIKRLRLGPPVMRPAAAGKAVPLFGGGADSEEAPIGLALATPLLALAEGRREIDLDLRIEWPDVSQNALLQAALQASTLEQLRPALGRLFACWMLSDSDSLSPLDRERLGRHVNLLGLSIDEPHSGVGSPLYLMCAPLPMGRAAATPHGSDGAAQALPAQKGFRPRDLAFFKYVNELFEVDLTHAEGWFAASRIQIGRPAPSRPAVPPEAPGHRAPLRNCPGGLQLKISLRPEDPPIVGCDPAVHGAQWPTRLPLLRLRVSRRARMHPYSLFDGAALVQAELCARVHGARQLVVHNNLGPLEAGKAFSPFGPLPSTSSYLLVGSPEAARKNLSALALEIEWGGLPQEPGGFAAHYQGYEPALVEGRFTAALSLLHDGQWQRCGGLSDAQPLFAAPDADGRLRATQFFEVDSESVRQHARASDAPLVVGPATRDGLLRLQLARPRAAFGHAAYPVLLSNALSAQARRRLRRPPALPNAPYTPVIERLTLDYTAVARLTPGRVRRSPGAPDTERLLHIHPFGIAELEPDAQLRHHGLLPALGDDGNLFIGLDADALQGPLSLLFLLRGDEAGLLDPGAPAPGEAPTDEPGPVSADALPGDAEPDPVRWSYLESNHWRPLERRHVQTDGTQGLLISGVVQLDLPDGARRGNSVLPAGLHWLRVSSRRAFRAAAPLIGVHAQALTLQRKSGEAGFVDAPLAAGRITQPAAALLGPAAVWQPEPSFGWQPAEDPTRFRVRAGERLRHRNRASLAWDIERLVLQAFPQVFKVKCLTAMEASLPAGQLCVVVVPRVHVAVPEDSFRAARLPESTLQEIRRFVAARSSPFAQVSVRNAGYERIQARCGVTLDSRAESGAVLRRIERALVEFISPWHEGGAGTRFGWVLRCDDVQAVVRAVPGVRSAGPLSLLHVVDTGSGNYLLADTARAGAVTRLLPHRNWNLPLPLAGHLLSVQSGAQPETAPASGLRDLGIGRTLVIVGGER